MAIPQNIEAKEDTGQRVTVRYEMIPHSKEKSTLSWFKKCPLEWSEAFRSKD